MRSRVPNTFDPDRRPGVEGKDTFLMQYVPEDDTAASQAAQNALATEVAGLVALNRANPANQVRPPSVIPDVPVTQGINTVTNTSTPTTTAQDLLATANPYTEGTALLTNGWRRHCQVTKRQVFRWRTTVWQMKSSHDR